MRLIVTDRLRRYILNREEGLSEIIRRAGRGKHSIYAAVRGDTSTLNDSTTAALACGLGLTEDELLRLALGHAQAGGNGGETDPCAGKPEVLRDLCQAWEHLDETARAMIEAVARAALDRR